MSTKCQRMLLERLIISSAIFFTLPILLVSNPASSQTTENRQIGLEPPGLTQNERRVRNDQSLLIESERIDANRSDIGNRSLTSLNSVPQVIANQTITSERDIQNLLPSLYPYYGFSEGAELRLTNTYTNNNITHYTLYQYIGGIRTDSTLTILVDSDTFQVEGLEWSLLSDRDYSHNHPLSADQAIDLVLRHIRENGQESMFTLSGEHVATPVFKPYGESASLGSWWEVIIQSSESLATGQEVGGFVHEYFFVDPDLSVASLIDMS